MARENEVARKRLRRRFWQVSVAAVGVAAWVVLVGGCGSTALPPKLALAQRVGVAGAQFYAVSVGVERFRQPVYSDRLAAALDATHLFAYVATADAFDSPPTFVGRVERPIYGTAVVPWLTGLSLGLVSTTVEEEHGFSFSLTRIAVPAPKIPVEFSYHGTTTLGWRALFLNFSDGTATDVYRHPRLNEHLAWAIVQQSELICQQVGGCHIASGP
jgi:hypothetical protein